MRHTHLNECFHASQQPKDFSDHHFSSRLAAPAALVAAPAANALTVTVTSSADSGAGSLRQAILDANSGAFPGIETISFAAPVTSITLDLTIVVTEALNIRP